MFIPVLPFRSEQHLLVTSSDNFPFRYANQAALERHRAAPYFRELIKKAPALLAKPLEIKSGSHLLPRSAHVMRL